MGTACWAIKMASCQPLLTRALYVLPTKAAGLSDGTDIGPGKYSSATSVGSLKEKIISQWPKDKENGPKSINDLKLIDAGKLLENNKTLAESRSPVSEVPGGVITMLVVLRPPMADKNNETLHDGSPKKSSCSCTIL